VMEGAGQRQGGDSATAISGLYCMDYVNAMPIHMKGVITGSPVENIC